MILALVSCLLAIAAFVWQRKAEKDTLAKAIAGAGWDMLAPLSLALLFYAFLIRWAEANSGQDATLAKLQSIASAIEKLESNKFLNALPVGGLNGFVVLAVIAIIQLVIRGTRPATNRAYKAFGVYRKIASFGVAIVTFLACFTLFDGQTKQVHGDLRLRLTSARNKLNGFAERVQETVVLAATAAAYQSPTDLDNQTTLMEQRRAQLAAQIRTYESARRNYESDFGGNHQVLTMPEAEPPPKAPPALQEGIAKTSEPTVQFQEDKLTPKQIDEADRKLTELEYKVLSSAGRAEESLLAKKVPTGVMKLVLKKKFKAVVETLTDLPFAREVILAVGDVVFDRIGDKLEKISERYLDALLNKEPPVDVQAEASQVVASEPLSEKANAAIKSSVESENRQLDGISASLKRRASALFADKKRAERRIAREYEPLKQRLLQLWVQRVDQFKGSQLFITPKRYQPEPDPKDPFARLPKASTFESKMVYWSIVYEVGSQVANDLEGVHDYENRLAALQEIVDFMEKPKVEPRRDIFGDPLPPSLGNGFPGLRQDPAPVREGPPPNAFECLDKFVSTFSEKAVSVHLTHYAMAIDEMGGYHAGTHRPLLHKLETEGKTSGHGPDWYRQYAQHRQQQVNFEESMRTAEARRRTTEMTWKLRESIIRRNSKMGRPKFRFRGR